MGGSRKHKATSDRPKLLRSCSTRDQAEQLSLDVLKTAHNLHSSNLPKSPHGPNSLKYAYFESCKDLRCIPWAGGDGPAVSAASDEYKTG